MKLLLLSDPQSAHTIKWANSLESKGIEIVLFGLSSHNQKYYNKNIKIETLNIPLKIKSKQDGAFSKIIYLAAIKKIKKIINEFKPDILHAHYASSYGLLGSLTGFHPFIISVWGSDIYNFPKKNSLYKKIIEFSLKRGDKILSTSHIMAAETNKMTVKKIEVTPFGIDVNKFRPLKVNSLFTPDEIVIGTIKTLEKKYGIEYLIQAFSIVKRKYPLFPLKLLIVGSGSLETSLKKMTSELNIKDDCIFTGYIKPDDIPVYHNMLDIYVSLSIEESESFGVAVLEASACGKPVIVSNVGGFNEIIIDGFNGFIVPKENIIETAKSIEKLIMDKSLRDKIGSAGRQHVMNHYNLSDNVDQMINIYRQCYE